MCVCAAPRVAFIKITRPSLLHERNLATWMVKSDFEFAEDIMGVRPTWPLRDY